MRFQIYSLILLVLIIIISILFFRLIKLILKEFNYHKAKDKVFNNIEMKLENSELGYFNKERIDSFLKKNGIQRKFTAEKFIVYKLIIAIVMCVVIGKEVNIFLGIFSFFLGFFLLDLLIIGQNKSEEIGIIIDLAEVCDSLKIQLKGGVHITNALTECYLISENKRLKNEFQVVQSELYVNHDLEKALTNFKTSFNNRYINSFVITILQGERSGKTNSAMEDLTKSFREISKVLDNKREKKIEYKVEVLAILILLWSLSVAGFVLATYVVENIKMFWRF